MVCRLQATIIYLYNRQYTTTDHKKQILAVFNLYELDLYANCTSRWSEFFWLSTDSLMATK